MINYSVYKHTFPNGKVYIGITSRKPESRWGLNGNGYKLQSLIYNAIQKYGWNNIKHEILFKNLTKKEAEQKEIELIAKYKSNNINFGYNISDGGNIISEDTRERISNALKGVLAGENNPNYGRCLSEETKIKISESIKGLFVGEKHPMFGKHHSEEAKRKIGEASRDRLSDSKNHYMYGKHHSEETKKKMSESHFGEKNYLYGKHRSEEVKRKISKSNPNSKRVAMIDKDSGAVLKIFNTIREAERETGIDNGSISKCCRGKAKTAGGYCWRYIYENELD